MGGGGYHIYIYMYILYIHTFILVFCHVFICIKYSRIANHVYIQTCVYKMYIYICIYKCIYIYMYIYMYIYVCVWVCADAYAVFAFLYCSGLEPCLRYPSAFRKAAFLKQHGWVAPLS